MSKLVGVILLVRDMGSTKSAMIVNTVNDRISSSSICKMCNQYLHDREIRVKRLYIAALPACGASDPQEIPSYQRYSFKRGYYEYRYQYNYPCAVVGLSSLC
jgi:hypothetical protein